MSRIAALTSWHADWRGLRVAVLGLGGIGFAVADTLAELGAEVLVLAEHATGDRDLLVPVIGAQLRLGQLSELPSELLDFAPELVVAAPEFTADHPVLVWARAHEIPVWGDIELAWRVRDKVPRADGSPAVWAFVAGASGKAVTATLAASMLVAGGLRAAPCGTEQVPALDAVRDPAGFDVLVVELSAAQLAQLAGAEPGGAPVPHASVCLRAAVAEQSWPGTVAAYREAEGVVYRNTVMACVYNKADPATRLMVEEAEVVEGARAIGIDLGIPGPSDLGVVEGLLVDRAFHEARRTSALELIDVDALAERGLGEPELVIDVLAAAAIARSLGVLPEAVNAALMSAAASSGGEPA